MERRTTGIFVILILTIAVLAAGFFILKRMNSQGSLHDESSESSFHSSYSEADERGTFPENSEANTTEGQEFPETGAAGGGGGGGIVNTVKNLIDEDCLGNQITYSMTDLDKTSVCNENQSEICVDKTVTCSIDVTNRDTETSGYFELELTFSESGNQSNVLKQSVSEFFIGPGEIRIFSDSLNLQGTVEDGIADMDVNCFFNTLEVPRKKIC